MRLAVWCDAFAKGTFHEDVLKGQRGLKIELYLKPNVSRFKT